MGCECVFKLFKTMGSGESWDSEPPCAQWTASSIYTSIPYTSCDGRGSMLGVTKNKHFYLFLFFIYYQWGAVVCQVFDHRGAVVAVVWSRRCCGVAVVWSRRCCGVAVVWSKRCCGVAVVWSRRCCGVAVVGSRRCCGVAVVWSRMCCGVAVVWSRRCCCVRVIGVIILCMRRDACVKACTLKVSWTYTPVFRYGAKRVLYSCLGKEVCNSYRRDVPTCSGCVGSLVCVCAW